MEEQGDSVRIIDVVVSYSDYRYRGLSTPSLHPFSVLVDEGR